MLDDQWAIRGASYEFRVGPVSEHPEMLLIRSEKPDFLFPPGRYGLVLKGQAYDFSIAGPITESVQCLERVEAANGNLICNVDLYEMGNSRGRALGWRRATG